jgi:hypothetical protein
MTSLNKVSVAFCATMLLAGCAAQESDDVFDQAPGRGKTLPPAAEESPNAIESSTQALTTFVNCSYEERVYLKNDLLPHAYRIAKAGRDYANTSPAVWAGYWFGDPIAGGVKDKLSHVASTLNPQVSGPRIICDGHNQYAHPSCVGFVARQNEAHAIRLCDGFWAQSHDEQVYTLLHESAHLAGAYNEDCSLGGGDNSQESCFYLARLDSAAAAVEVWAYEWYYRGWL